MYLIEQGHKHGVPVYGVVNLQPKTFGGEFSNLTKLLEIDERDGTFINADRLIAIAQSFGFDGWFINQETEGGLRADSIKMAQFMRYFQMKSPKHINLIWYDSMVRNGQIDHQGALTMQNHEFYAALTPINKTGQMMIDYRWTREGLQGPDHIATNHDEQVLFYGLDAHEIRQDSYSYKMLKTMNRNIALFASNWYYDEACSISMNYELSREFWYGAYRHNWPGVCSYVRSSPVIISLPFSTSFNLGQGEYYYHMGKRHLILNTNGYGWTQPQQQTPMPDNCQPHQTDELAIIQSDTTVGYQGSGSIRVFASSEKMVVTQLFSAKYPMNGDEFMTLTYTHSNKELKAALILRFSNGDPRGIELPACSGKWCNMHISLDREAGKILRSIQIALPAGFEHYPLYIGQLGLFREMSLLVSSPNVWISDQQFYKNRRQLRLNWTQDSDAEHYLLFTVDDNGKPDHFIGQTRHTSWVVEIPENRRVDRISVTPVSEEGNLGVSGVIGL